MVGVDFGVDAAKHQGLFCVSQANVQSALRGAVSSAVWSHEYSDARPLVFGRKGVEVDSPNGMAIFFNDPPQLATGVNVLMPHTVGLHGGAREGGNRPGHHPMPGFVFPRHDSVDVRGFQCAKACDPVLKQIRWKRHEWSKILGQTGIPMLEPSRGALNFETC